MDAVINKINFVKTLPGSLKSLIFNSAIVAFGSYMVTPFLGVYLKYSLRFPVKTVGVLVALSTFVQFGGGILGAVVAERIGLKKTMVYSLCFRTLGFVLLGLAAKEYLFILPAILLVAAGSAAYIPANRAYIVSTVNADLRPLFLSLSTAALSAGMAAGPFVATLFIEDQAPNLFYAVAILFVGLAIIHQWTLVPEAPTASLQPQTLNFRHIPVAILSTRTNFLFSTLTFFLYFFFQSYIALYVTERLASQFVRWLLLANFLTIFFLQPLVARRTSKASYQNVLLTGFLLMGVGFSLFSLGKLVFLILGTIIMTAGQSLLNLRGDIEVITRLPANPALAIGIQRLTTGIGGALTGICGGYFFDIFQKKGELPLFWIFVTGCCAVAALLSQINLGREERIEKLT